MMVGFFMILLDSTIVAVANPSIMAKLGTGYDTVIWVTSAYLLAYAVPLLVAGRLGDRFGPKNLYLLGLAIFTAASLWCGLSGTIGMLIAARVVQGIGAGVLTPQTLSVITRIFPPERRGMAMSVWGATAGVATLVGPLAGGVLVDALGWAWIFFVNVPIGIIGLGLAVWLMPDLPTHKHRFDLVGVGLSGVAMFLIVFALQEGQAGGWAPWIWAVFVAGVGFMTAFVYWQSISTDEPLIPLDIFRDRDFSLANLAGRGHRVRGHRDGAAADVLRAGGVRIVANAFGSADRADGDYQWSACADRRQDRRPVPPPVGGRFRLLGVGDRTDLALDRDDAVRAHLAVGVAIHCVGSWDGVHLGAVGGHRDPQPAAAPCRRRFRCVQRDPSGRCRVGQRRHGLLHDVEDHLGDAADARRRRVRSAGGQGHRLADAGVPARAVLGGDVPVDAAAGVYRVVRR